MYDTLFRLGLARMDAETAHHLAGTLIRFAGAVPPLRATVRATFGRSTGAPVRLFGREVPGRLGLAAGFDKDATMAAGLGALGFAFVEVGTSTAHAQPGNDKPRLRRVVERSALVNRMGFNNAGAAAAARRLARLRRTPHGRRMLLGANIGKTKLTPARHAVTDYVTSARALAPHVDYLVVNVSSPNTPGLRDLQQVETLRPILAAVRDAAAAAAAREVPVLVKIAPDLADADVDGVARLAAELHLAGVVAVNTTIGHDYGAGGLSGAPLLDRGVQVVRRVRAALGEEAVVIGVGGISSAADAQRYLDAGATVVQAYTAFVYRGPAWPGRVNRELARRSVPGAPRRQERG
nr:quinone-dependent dihydroorotate dehydrogenase [Ruania albidiflava]